MQIEGLVAVVTGAASGLGYATAKVLSEAGATVVLVDRDAARVGAAAAELGCRFEVLDVADAAAAEAVFTAITNGLGAPRVLVNCAGIAPGARIVSRDGAMPLADFEQVIRVNLIGSFNMLRLAAAAMSNASPLNEDGERGVIINTASVAAFEGQIGQAAYSASKGGIAALTLPAARDLARSGIRVLAIAPGILKTPMVAGLPEPVQESLGAAVPFPSRLGHPEEYASLVMEMIRNTLLNGETIRLDGALRLAPKVSLEIRPYAPADWPALWGIIEPILRAGETYPQPRETSEAEAKRWWIDEHRAVFVAEEAGQVLGSYYLTDNKPGLGSHVANAGFIVAPSAAGRGVGRAMGKHSLTAAREHGYLALQFNLVVVTNEASIRIWDALGFTRVGILPKAFRHATEGLVDALVMYKWLGD